MEYQRPLNALIIRSASFQQLDQNLPELLAAFPDHRFDMLTHEHGMKLALKYQDLNRIISYSHSGSFSIRRREPGLRGIRYDVVIIPVANLTGAGFLNVLFFSLTIKTNRRFLCNMVSDIKRVTVPAILLKGLGSVINKFVSGLLTLATYPILRLALPRMLSRLDDPSRKGNS